MGTRIGYLIAVLVNVFMLWAVHQHPTWIPWLGGIVTDSFADIVWAIDLSIWVQIIGNGILIAIHPRILRRLLDVVSTVFGALSLYVTWTVYPFEFDRLYVGLDGIVPIVLVVLLVVMGFAFIANVVRVIAAPLSREDDDED
jgi:TRAP-type C4-dicarboxylate transport system permease small subunit